MKKLTAILIPFLFGFTVITTVHSFADLQEHFFHLLLIGGMSIFSLWFIYKDSFKTKFNKSSYPSQFKLLVLFLLFAFAIIRVVPCHLLSSNPQDIAHATVINHPCCSAITSATAEVSITPIMENITQIEQKPHLTQLPLYISQLTNKSPPLSA